MREIGIVKSIEEGFGIICLDAKGGCKSCGMNAVCHSSGTGTRELRLELHGMDVKTDDLVEIETRARSVLTASFLVFILPLLLSISAYFVIAGLAQNSGKGIIGFFICFILSEFLIGWIDRKFGRGQFFQPRIVQILETNGKNLQENRQTTIKRESKP